MASFYNSFTVTTAGVSNLIGSWEDIKIYSSVYINVKAPATSALNGVLSILWGTDSNGTGVITSLKRTDINVALLAGASELYRFSVNSDWFMLEFNGTTPPLLPVNTIISTVYKSAQSQFLLEDRSYDIAGINVGAVGNSIKTRIGDASGTVVTNTGTTDKGNGLYTHMDISSNNSLGVSIGSSSSSQAGALKTIFSDYSGNGMASTISGGFFYALTDVSGYTITSTKTQSLRVHNAANISLTDHCGTSIDWDNPYYVNITNPVQHINNSFLLTLPGPTAPYLVSHTDIQNPAANKNIALLTLGITNETPDPLWVKVYDMSSGETGLSSSALVNRVKFNIPVPGFQTRDLHMSKGVFFDRGVYFRITMENAYNSTPLAIGDVLVMGTYRIVN